MPATLEIGIIFCTYHRPRWQRHGPIECLHYNLDSFLQEHSCKQVIIVGDTNQNQVKSSVEELLTVFGLKKHVSFLTHDDGSYLDPVITDFPGPLVSGRPLGNVGSCNHQAVHISVKIRPTKDAALKRTTWRSKKEISGTTYLWETSTYQQKN